MSNEVDLKAALAQFEPASDVEDLDTARRFITALRKMIADIQEETEALDSALLIDLDEERERKVQLLYDRRKLAYEQEDDAYHDEYEFEEVFQDFVNAAIDVAWDLAQSEEEHGVQRPLTA